MVLINGLSRSVFSLLLLLCLTSCQKSIPDKIEDFINKKHLFDKSDTCIINLFDVLNIEYDTIYLFNSLIPLSGLNDIVGRKNNEVIIQKNRLAGTDSDIHIYFKKNGAIVLEDSFSKSNHLRIRWDSFQKQHKTTIFDGEPINVFGYYSSNNEFIVVNLKEYYILLDH